MAELLDRIEGEIRERLDASRAAVDEVERLQSALHALQAGNGERPKPVNARRRRSRAATNTRAPAAANKRAPAPTSRASASARRQRAPRGANREAVLAAVRARPGVTPNEVSSASGVKRGVVYNELRRLVSGGELVKQQLPSGRTGYMPA
jgi:sugar-specific transcriptional regulator TrmB